MLPYVSVMPEGGSSRPPAAERRQVFVRCRRARGMDSPEGVALRTELDKGGVPTVYPQRMLGVFRLDEMLLTMEVAVSHWRFGDRKKGL
jgi:hypothetical protein